MNILDIGIDIVEIHRIKDAMKNNPRFLDQYLQKMKLNTLNLKDSKLKPLQVILQQKKL